MVKINIKDEINKIRQLKKQYRWQELKYLGYKLKEMTQEDVISQIEDLSFAELRLLFGAGIPGEAYIYAIQRYNTLRKLANEYEQELVK